MEFFYPILLLRFTFYRIVNDFNGSFGLGVRYGPFTVSPIVRRIIKCDPQNR